jgi:glycosyltransferase involved in cell wall biosynthesis
MSYITVCTPTYNRAHTLPRVFQSLKKQQFKDFEWLIIDDGSTDNTKQIVDGFIKEANFPIRYYYKENGGRHTALNYSYGLISSEYVINLDSDDELTEHALVLVKKAWDSIHATDYDRFWCVSGRCIDSQTNKIVGKLYPDGINKLKGRRQHKEITKCKGEKHCCRKTSILKQYPFPVFNDTKFVSESMIWEKINLMYNQYCVNDAFSIYYTDSPDSLCAGKTHSTTRRRTFYYFSLFYINDLFNQLFYNRNVIFSIVNVSRCGMLSGTNMKTTLSSINKWYKKILVLLGYPISYTWIKLFYNKD